MTSLSAFAALRHDSANLLTFFTSRGARMRNTQSKTRVDHRSKPALPPGSAGSRREFWTWLAGVSLLVLLLCLSPLAFSQTCSTSCTGLCLQQTTCSGSATTPSAEQFTLPMALRRCPTCWSTSPTRPCNRCLPECLAE
jgi:hypothetical protein